MSNRRAYLVSIIASSLFLLSNGCQRSLIQQQAAPVSTTPVRVDTPTGVNEVLERSTDLIQDFGFAAGRDIVAVLFADALGMAVIPSLTESAYTASGNRGTGLFLTRVKNRWSLPVFVSISGGGLGEQIGPRSTDVLLVFRKPGTISRLKKEGSIGLAGLAAALGPIGASADLSFLRNADVVAYKCTGGQFLGFHLSGGVLSLNPEMTLAYYSEPQRGSVRGYYSARGYYEDEAERLVNGLLNMDERSMTQTIPKNAEKVKLTLDRMTSAVNR